MGDVDWSGDVSIRLVEEYKERPELWDNTHSLYRVATAKYEAWADMARIFECDIGDLRKKLNSIFASYRREKGKIRNGGRSTWFLYNYLRFLPSHLHPNTAENDVEVIVGTSNDVQFSRQTTTDRSDQSSDDDDDNDDSGEQRQIIIKQEPIIETYCIGGPATSSEKKRPVRPKQLVKKYKLTRPLLKRKPVKEPETLDGRLLETLRLLRKSDLSRKKDECDSFGEYIAVSLRKHDERTQSMIKQAINNILFEQEMKKYNTNQYTVVLAGVDENPLVIGDENK